MRRGVESDKLSSVNLTGYSFLGSVAKIILTTIRCAEESAASSISCVVGEFLQHYPSYVPSGVFTLLLADGRFIPPGFALCHVLIGERIPACYVTGHFNCFACVL